MRILIASTYVPYIRGGGTKIVEDLRQELVARGFETDAVYLPFYPSWKAIPDQTAALRLLDVGGSCGGEVDRLITIRTPSYALRHPNKVVWFIHHHREAYDLWGTRWSGMPDDSKGRYYRDLIRRSDDIYLRECRKVYTNSRIVAKRLSDFNALEADGVLYPPLPRDHPFRPGPFGDYLYYPSRLSLTKRQALAIEALKYTDPNLRLVISGTGDEDAYEEELHRLVEREGLSDRVRLTGWVSEDEKAKWMANCCGALYLAYDEDSYGYVTLEAFEASKPVITLTDSGGSLELVVDGVNGLVAEPEPRALAEAMNRLWRERRRARKLGVGGQKALRAHRISWDHVIGSLTA
jgi:glycosyltransferase involved in cell wall biosynthesis